MEHRNSRFNSQQIVPPPLILKDQRLADTEMYVEYNWRFVRQPRSKEQSKGGRDTAFFGHHHLLTSMHHVPPA